MAEENSLSDRHKEEHDEFIKRFGNFEGAPEILTTVRDNIRHMYWDVIHDCIHQKISPDEFIEQTEGLMKRYEGEIDDICLKYMIQKEPYVDLIRRHHNERVEKEKKWLKIMAPYIKK